jgi:dTDP-4-dehydrorhamnose reductase
VRMVILGGAGMLGHQLWRYFHLKHEVWATLRQSINDFAQDGLFTDNRVITGLDATDFEDVRRRLTEVRPDVVLSCIGIVKQLKEAKAAIPSITINALLPHKLAEICGHINARLVLFSTDCVFSGQKGCYTEDDVADAMDMYGRTKFLGEVCDSPRVITLRSSIIGRELRTAHSLIDWFLSQRDRGIGGYRRAIYSGFTTIEMCRIVDLILTRHPLLSGLWHVSSDSISKHDLLLLARAKFGVNIDIVPDDSFVADRSLDSTRFRTITGYQPPSWPSMIEELARSPR